MDINVERQPAINKMDNKMPLDNKAAFTFGCRTPPPDVGKLFGNVIISNADADKICAYKRDPKMEKIIHLRH